MTGEGDRYIHGTEPEEQRRLSLLNRLLNPSSLEALRLRGGERILDVGSGLGQLTRDMARAAGPRGKVIGVERDPRQRAEARRQADAACEGELVELRDGDAVELPLAEGEWGTFDVVHARFVLEHVTDPVAVVRSMVRAARPGGRIVLEDDDHELLRLHPDVPATRRLWQAYYRTFDRLGRDPHVGRHLVRILHEAGATPRRNDALFFGSCAGSPELAAMMRNFAGVMDGARGDVLRAGEIDDRAFDEGLAALEAWSRRPDAALWYVTCWAEGERP